MTMNLNENSSVGNVVLSFDFEIGWGDVTNEMWRVRERNNVYVRLRQVLPEILAHMDSCEVAATWATVGAMIDSPSERTLDHLPANAGSVVSGSLSSAKADSFDGRDLFEQVMLSSARHHIGCHSYSHIPFYYPGVSEAFVRQELIEFKRTLARYGMSTDRFVFPENCEGFWSALSDSGFEVARVAAANRFRNRWLYLASIAVVPPPAAREEQGDAGVTRSFGSMLFNAAGQDWRVPLLKRRLELGLKHVVGAGDTLHIWSHPFNFAESDRLKNAFIEFLTNIARLRDAGRLTISVM